MMPFILNLWIQITVLTLMKTRAPSIPPPARHRPRGRGDWSARQAAAATV